MDLSSFSSAPVDDGTMANALQDRYENQAILEKVYAGWRNRSVDVRAGDSYVSFGRGMALSLRARAARAARTAAYVAALDPAVFERRGVDFASPRYDPGRLGIPLDRVDPARDYDFEGLAELETRLAEAIAFGEESGDDCFVTGQAQTCGGVLRTGLRCEGANNSDGVCVQISLVELSGTCDGQSGVLQPPVEWKPPMPAFVPRYMPPVRYQLAVGQVFGPPKWSPPLLLPGEPAS